MKDRARMLFRRRSNFAFRAVVVAVAAVMLILCVACSGGKNSSKTPFSADVYNTDPNKFAVPDFDAPTIFEDEAYLSLDRDLHVKRGGEEYTVSVADPENANAAERFFLAYFDALEHGETDRYNSMFTDAYYLTRDRQGAFTEQRVYDIHLTLLDALDDESRASYMVEYRIARNNGSFRRDIYSDSSRPVIVDLVFVDGAYKIDSMKYPGA